MIDSPFKNLAKTYTENHTWGPSKECELKDYALGNTTSQTSDCRSSMLISPRCQNIDNLNLKLAADYRD